MNKCRFLFAKIFVGNKGSLSDFLMKMLVTEDCSLSRCSLEKQKNCLDITIRNVNCKSHSTTQLYSLLATARCFLVTLR
jgi:hypothetical protein